MSWISIGSLWAFLAVALGAFGAHGLKRWAGPEALAWWQTGTHYHLVHALAIVAVGLVQAHRPGVALAGWAFLAGTLLFSGTLYAMALGAPRWFGAVTPVGGVLLLAGWLLLAWRSR